MRMRPDRLALPVRRSLDLHAGAEAPQDVRGVAVRVGLRPTPSMVTSDPASAAAAAAGKAADDRSPGTRASMP